MMKTEDGVFMTVREAAARIEKSTRTIENYITGGLVVRYFPPDHRRYVAEVELVEMFRVKIIAGSGSKWARLALGKGTR